MKYTQEKHISYINLAMSAIPLKKIEKNSLSQQLMEGKTEKAGRAMGSGRTSKQSVPSLSSNEKTRRKRGPALCKRS